MPVRVLVGLCVPCAGLRVSVLGGHGHHHRVHIVVDRQRGEGVATCSGAVDLFRRSASGSFSLVRFTAFLISPIPTLPVVKVRAPREITWRVYASSPSVTPSPVLDDEVEYGLASRNSTWIP
ncbi:hypothetical protein B484DRAFT_440311 [Ochromonadaceae sp. CCMP2298]|nr:hypothetical protein B484DRAFT_440311 [Ochromonadaceae sp. CCMP2298]